MNNRTKQRRSKASCIIGNLRLYVRKTESKEAESRREQCSTELGRQLLLEIMVGSVSNGIAQYCAEKLQLADMLRSDLAN